MLELRKVSLKQSLILRCCAQAFIFILVLSGHAVNAAEYFRLGTGGNGGTYLPIGSLIANAINQRQISTTDGNQLIVLPQRSNGSVANLIDISESLLEGGLAQADTVSKIYEELIADQDTRDMLRTVGSLYLESLHLVVTTDSGISELSDLVGKRVSVDELGSGTQQSVEILMSAYGLSSDKYKNVYLKLDDSIDRMRRGTLDAFFVFAGFPLVEVKQLVDDGVGKVIGVEPAFVTELAEKYLYLSGHTIPQGVYANGAEISTLGVSAQLIVRTDVDEGIVYEITKTLWSKDTLEALEVGHPRGGDIIINEAFKGVGIPLHDGARRYYQERGYEID